VAPGSVAGTFITACGAVVAEALLLIVSPGSRKLGSIESLHPPTSDNMPTAVSAVAIVKWVRRAYFTIAPILETVNQPPQITKLKLCASRYPRRFLDFRHSTDFQMDAKLPPLNRQRQSFETPFTRCTACPHN
jgi:hypothetical protein